MIDKAFCMSKNCDPGRNTKEEKGSFYHFAINTLTSSKSEKSKVIGLSLGTYYPGLRISLCCGQIWYLAVLVVGSTFVRRRLCDLAVMASVPASVASVFPLLENIKMMKHISYVHYSPPYIFLFSILIMLFWSTY